MEQIIVTRKDGSTYTLLNRAAATSIVKFEQTVELLGADTIDLSLESATKIVFTIGDKITIYGRDYTLNTPATERKLGERHFVYDVQFEGVQYDLLRAAFSVNVDTTSNEIQDLNGDSLTGDIEIFLNVLISNVTRVFPGKWQLGTYPVVTETKTLSFGEDDNCLTVLQHLCSEDVYNTEFRIDIDPDTGVRTINIGEVGTIHPYTFEYGKGKGIYELTRQKSNSSNIITRLNVFGSSRNINTSKYRAFKLCLPGKSKGESYIENVAAQAVFGIWESTKTFDDVYPRRTGVVSALGSDELTFVDSSMDFDLNARDGNGNTLYLIHGSSAKVHFNTGRLAGYEFEITKYDHTTKTFTLRPFTDENGYTFPSKTSAAFQIAEDDTYVLLDIYLPQSYIDSAESELEERGEAYLDTYSQPRVEYALALDRFFLRDLVGAEVDTNIIWAGDTLNIRDTDIEVDKAIRIKAFTRDLLNPYSYELTVSDMSRSVSIINRVVSDVRGLSNIVRFNHLNDIAKARRNYLAAQEVLSMIFDTEGDFYTEKIKPLSIDTTMLSVGSKAMQFSIQGLIMQPNYAGEKNRIVYSDGTLAHLTVLDSNGDPRIWDIVNGDVTLGTDGAYYIYARCERSGNGGTVLFSTDKIQADTGSTYYHFLLGVINSVGTNNERAISLMYGFSTINGRFIKTGRIVSSDGSTYFDLDTGELRGNFKFTSGESVEESIQEQIDAIQVGGRNLAKGTAVPFTVTGTNSANHAPVLYGTAPISAGVMATLSFDWKVEGAQPSGTFRIIQSAGSFSGITENIEVSAANSSGHFVAVVTMPSSQTNGLRVRMDYLVGVLTISNLKLERGNKATDWTPAPEDVDAEIATAKQEALTAAGNAQSTANSANSAVGTLSGYVDGAFKDGVIDAAEAKAIEKYKNTLNEAMSKAEASYNKVYTNTYLSGAPKTALQNAKINLWGQRDTLIGAINTAIAGGTTTPAQKANVDSAFGTFNTLMNAFQNALEDANKAIQVKLDNISKGYVDAVQVGGRNHIPNSSLKGTDHSLSGNLTRVNDSDGLMLTRVNTTDPARYFCNSHFVSNFALGDQITLSAWIRLESGIIPAYNSTMFVRFFNSSGGNVQDVVTINISHISSDWVKVTGTGTITNSEIDFSRNIQVAIAIPTPTAPVTIQTREWKLEKGNRATDWTPAPEDVPSSLEYLAKAIQGSTEIDGGLTMTNLLLLKNLAGQITGGMSGLDGDNVLLFGGGDYQAALDSAVQTLIRKDGTGLLGDGRIQWDLAGLNVGDLEIDSSGAVLLKESGVLKLLITRNAIMSPEALIGGGQSSETSFTSTTNAATGVTEVTKGTYTINNDGTEVTVTTTLSALLQLSQPHGYSTATIFILARYPSSGKDYVFDSYSLSASGTTEQKTGSKSVNKTVILPAGTMQLVVRFENVNSIVDAPAGFSCSASAGTIDIFHSVSNPHSEIGKNGFMFGKDSYNFAYFGVDSSDKFRAILRSTGDFDMPGVLLQGTVESSGGNSTATWWGPKKVTTTPSKTSTGRYVIYHNVGHVNYTVTAASRIANRSYHIVSKDNTQFIIEWRTIGSSPTLNDTAFDFTISGLNFLAP